MHLCPATPEELQQALSFALQFDGRKHFRTAGESMAAITAAHLVEQLKVSGFVVMKRPEAKPYSAISSPGPDPTRPPAQSE